MTRSQENERLAALLYAAQLRSDQLKAALAEKVKR